MSGGIMRKTRWWRWALASVVLAYATLYVAAAWLRQHNTRRCHQAIAALETQGYACRPEPIAVGPDAVAHEDFWKRAIAMASIPREKPKRLQAWLAGTAPDPGPDAVAWLRDRRAEFADLLAIVRTGGVALSNANCPAPMAAPPPGAPPGMPLGQWRSEAMSVACAMADWQRVEALLAEDPAPHLAELQLLVRACAPPAGLIDLFMAIRLHDIRDETTLEVVRLGTAPRQATEAWLADPIGASGLLARAWRGERMQSWATSEWLITYDGGSDASLIDRMNPFGWWFLATLPDGEARRMLDLATFEAQAGGRAPPSAALGIGGGTSVVYRIAMPNLMESPISVSEFAQRAHLRRLAARVILMSRDRGSLPRAQGDLAPGIDPALLAVGDDHGATAYVPAGTTGFVLTSDASTRARRLPAPRTVTPLRIELDMAPNGAP